MTTNLIGSGLLAFTMFFGCGSAQEEPIHAHHEPVLPNATESARNVEVPEVTVRAMKACVDAVKIPRTETSHAFQYNLQVNERGNVSKVHLQDATTRESSLEACFKQALEAMVVPDEALRMRVVRPVSGGENMSSIRGDLSVVQAAAAPIALAPILIPALGVTIIVAISLDIIRKATSGRDCKEVKEQCIEYCSETTLPTGDYGWKFQKCKNECLERHGCPRAS